MDVESNSDFKCFPSKRQEEERKLQNKCLRASQASGYSGDDHEMTSFIYWDVRSLSGGILLQW